ncbi:Gfo/Idh/MocA family protein [uncultured Amnibacterium sp.]|uniref:Gfo/Idh/MocA family protein n=1 Tax=uncultured Amnibacterium sp. TaxID=1631851 RepID=UPI0035C96E5D
MNQLRVGLVGAGVISTVHAAAWRDLDAEVLVFSETGAVSLAERFGFRTVPSLQELFDSVEIVDVCTPTPTHEEIARRALQSGADVVCEKPLARTAAAAARLIDDARRLGRKIYPGHVVRYFPEYVALRDAVAAGRLGELAVLRFTRGGPAPAGSWFFDETDSGGLLLDQMIHDLDQARWIAGPVVQVFASQNPTTLDSRVRAPVVCHAVLTHASGALSFIQGVWGAPGMRFTTSFDVAGSAGRLQYDSATTAEIQANLSTDASGNSSLPGLVGESPYTAEIREFVSAFAGGADPRVTGNDAVIAIGLAEAALESVRLGAPVPFDETTLSELSVVNA